MDGQGIQVRIATPAYGGMMCVPYVYSLMHTAFELQDHNIGCGMLGTTLESLIPRARNDLVANFLAEPGTTHLMFIDADMQWQPEALLRLIQADVDVACGPYCRKTPPFNYTFHPLTDEATGRTDTRDPKTGLIQITAAGTGFMLIKRGVFLRLIAEGAVERIWMPGNLQPPARPFAHVFFPVGMDGANYQAEDYGFCRLVRSIGCKIWLDPDIELGHIGTHTFRGNRANMFADVTFRPAEREGA
jgi:hypothetical protein